MCDVGKKAAYDLSLLYRHALKSEHAENQNIGMVSLYIHIYILKWKLETAFVLGTSQNSTGLPYNSWPNRQEASVKLKRYID